MWSSFGSGASATIAGSSFSGRPSSASRTPSSPAAITEPAAPRRNLSIGRSQGSSARLLRSSASPRRVVSARAAVVGARRPRRHVRTARRIASPGGGERADPTGDDVRRHPGGRAHRHRARELRTGAPGPPTLADDFDRLTHLRRGRRSDDDPTPTTAARATVATTTHRPPTTTAPAPIPARSPDRRAPDRVGRDLHRRRERTCGRRSARTSPSSALPFFFPKSAYLQVKAINDPAATTSNG